MSNYEWDKRSTRIAIQNRDILERTSASLARSNQVAIETEQIGTEIVGELSEQRESLLRNQTRLQNADDHLSKSNAAIRAIRKNVLYNKLILILIIILELGILIGLIFLKFISK